EIARYSHYDYVFGGAFGKRADQYLIRTTLYTVQGKRVGEHSFQGLDLFRLVDEVSLQLKRDLGVPAARIESGPDLPVAEITTRSLPALRESILGLNQFYFHNDPIAAMAKLERAVSEDPSFAFAAFGQVYIAANSNQLDKLSSALALAERNEFRLPE